MRMIGLAIILTVGLLAVPLAPEAQPAAKVHRVGVLSSGSVALDEVGNGRQVFLGRLSDLGWVVGQSLKSLPTFLSSSRRNSSWSSL
jgi:hypothetical protein